MVIHGRDSRPDQRFLMKLLLVLSGLGVVLLVAAILIAAFVLLAGLRKRRITVAPPGGLSRRPITPAAAQEKAVVLPGPSDRVAGPAPAAPSDAKVPDIDFAAPPPAFTEPIVVESADIPFDPNETIVVNTHAHRAIVCTSGPLTGRTFALTDRGLYIGSDWAEAQVVIDDPRVSKRHVWVGISEGRVVAVDQDSANGTFVNSLDNRISEVTLSPGDALILPEDLARFALRM